MAESIDSLVARIEDAKSRIQESQNSLTDLRGNGISIREGMVGPGEGKVGAKRIDFKAGYAEVEVDERGARISSGLLQGSVENVEGRLGPLGIRAERIDFKAGYAEVEVDERGARISSGVASVRGEGSLIKEYDISTYEGKVGTWEDANGNTRGGFSGNFRGARTEVDLANGLNLPEENVLEVELGAGTAAVEASAGTDGFSFGGSADLASVAITEGTSSAEIENDETTRIGANLGPGAGVRGHWDDVDGDGFREVGLGADVPLPAGIGISLDVKTEDPLRTALNSIDGGLIPDAITDAILPEGNLTESTVNLFGGSIRDENAPNA
ncbi:hypothetical protein [Leptolyngbya sp. FACHB-261]|uniref:hypothetical protein n=1 Tax=Leptolyngbya sp. FACHB-261 TaxID=2692806 RepID=UPI001684806D|nr:hypothetical protein [Leptolyngbya sp. FACHB-261]MBD2103982.1 hypothetical protein [Leptolyngbya sp. FACHB-261]